MRPSWIACSLPRYGERMACVASSRSIADTSGYQSDGDRSCGAGYWVIDAYNSNMPFDQFTVEQIAGDLLPNATPDQIIATGFNRNHRGNAEEYPRGIRGRVRCRPRRHHSDGLARIDARFARCHDHNRSDHSCEFYQFFAYFNNVPERGRAIKYGDSPPVFPSPTRDQQAKLEKLESNLRDAKAAVETLRPSLAAAQAAWEPTVALSEGADWSVTRNLATLLTFDEEETHRDGQGIQHTAGRIGQAVSFDGRLRRRRECRKIRVLRQVHDCGVGVD